MNIEDLRTVVFPASQAKRLLTTLEQKRDEYWRRIYDPEKPWSHVPDIVQRHNTEYSGYSNDFKLLYYKFYVLAQVIFLTKKADEFSKIDALHIDEYPINGALFASDLNPMLDNTLDFEIFYEACLVVRSYID